MWLIFIPLAGAYPRLIKDKKKKFPSQLDLCPGVWYIIGFALKAYSLKLPNEVDKWISFCMVHSYFSVLG